MRDLKIQERYTNRTSVTDRYLVEVSRHDILGADAEYEIAVKASEGDQEAIEKLITSNLRFVVSVAKQYASQAEMLDELIAQGNIGLIDAAKTFDPSRGFKFISYAVWHIRKEILKYLNEIHRTVKVPLNITTDNNRVKRVESDLVHLLDREPTVEEIVEEMEKRGWEITPEKVKLGRRVTEKIMPFELGLSDGETMWSPSDWVSSGSTASEFVEAQDTSNLIDLAMEGVSYVERDIILRYHGIRTGIPESFSSISHSYEKSSEWARQRYKKAMRRIQTRARREKLHVNL